ncbi:MAG: DpnI domain-containing protein [bacterium]
MNLDMTPSLGLRYKSPLQIARVVSEDWAMRNLYCPACKSDKLSQAPTNTRAIDLLCPECSQVFQLKSGQHWNQRKIVDAGYAPMIAAIRSDSVPNLVVMQYTASWKVQNLLLVPYFFFTETVLERRKPLSPTARRAGWVGCNILLKEIPPDGKLNIVEDGLFADVRLIRKHFEHIRGLSNLKGAVRGWTLDVLKAVRKLNKSEFALSEIYAFEPLLAEAYPGNRNVRQKIRQQLQKLRDLKFLEFVSPGHYRVIESESRRQVYGRN